MGKVIMSGIVPTLKAPVTGVLASSLAVGSTVKLMEGGTAVEYLVVNQGIPRQSIQITVEIACFNITFHCTVCIRCIRLYQIIDWIELSSLSIFTNIGHQKYHIQFFTARKHQVRLVVISTPFNNLKFYFCIYLFSDDLIHCILYGLHICR